MQKILSILLIAAFITFSNESKSQGCVAIRSTGGVCGMDHSVESMTKPPNWILNVNNRYFKSYKHYVGTVEQKERVEAGTEVINHAYTMDLSLTRTLSNRMSVAVGLPILANSRSQRSKFGNKDRFLTHSFGLGDMHVSVYRWMLDPVKSTKGNFQLGLGLKFATGDYKFQDYFPSSATAKELRTVDQSIQLGDGGTGFITELNGFYNFSNQAGMYGNVYYLFNPREQNGVPTFRSNVNEAIMSVADQFMARAGFNYTPKSLKHLSASLGARIEGIPAKDIIGGSEGFRRPGYIISAEPGVNLNFKRSTFYLAVPVALVRNRTQSVPDKETTAQTGVYAQGDAAFADYLINVGFSVKF